MAQAASPEDERQLASLPVARAPAGYSVSDPRVEDPAVDPSQYSPQRWAEAAQTPFLALPHKTVEEHGQALDLLNQTGLTAALPPPLQTLAALRQVRPRTAALLAKIGTDATTGLAEFMESPLGIATVAAGAGGSAVKKAIGLGFAAHGIKDLPDAFSDVANAQTDDELSNAVLRTAFDLGMGVGGVHELGGRPSMEARFGVPQAAPPAPPLPLTPGAPTVVFGSKGTQLPAQYAFAPTAAIETSHAGQMMGENPNYALQNTRDYSDPAERDKQLDVLQNFDPRRHVTDAPDASVGPSIVGTVIDEDGNASLQRFGGNNRGYAIANLPPERRTQLQALQNAKAGQFGLQPSSDPDAELVRHIGTFDFRQPGEQARAQAIVDALNPSPGLIQGTAKRAEIDAQSVPADLLKGIPMDIAPPDAQAMVQGLIQRGLADRNLTANIAASPAAAQNYVQRLLVNAAFRDPNVFEHRDWRGETTRGMIDAATPALVQMRALPNGEGVADAVSRAFQTTLDYLRKGSTLPDALDLASRQTEIDPEHAVAQDVAGAMRDSLVLDKAGKVRSAESLDNLQKLFARMQGSLEHYNPEPDIFGGQETVGGTIRRALGLPEKATPGALGMPEPAAGPESFGTPEEILARHTNARGVTVLNGDDLTAQHPAFRATTGLGEGIRTARALHPAATQARDAAFAAALKSHPSPVVTILAGGAGSGKSSFLARLPRGSLVLDSNLRDVNQARRWIADIRAAGKTPEVVYIHRPFEEAVMGNLNRALEQRRLVEAPRIAAAHADARATIEQLLSDPHRPDISIYRNHQGAGYEPMTEQQLRAEHKPTVDELHARAQNIADAIQRQQQPGWRRGRLPGELYQAFTGRENPLAEGEKPTGSGGGQRANTGGNALGDPGAPAHPGALASPGAPVPAARQLQMAMVGKDQGMTIPKVLASYEKIAAAAGKNVLIRFGRFLQRASGVYSPFSGVARVMNASNLATAAHELAHGLQHAAFGDANSAVLNRTLPVAATAELRKLGVALYGAKMPANGYESEGWAEYWRHHLTEDDAQKVAPEMYKYVTDEFLRQRPGVARAVAEARANTDAWRSQGALARAKNSMVQPPTMLQRLGKQIVSTFSKANWIEEAAAYKELAEEHFRLTGTPLTASTNPYEVFSARRGTSGAVALQMASHAMIRLLLGNCFFAPQLGSRTGTGVGGGASACRLSDWSRGVLA